MKDIYGYVLQIAKQSTKINKYVIKTAQNCPNNIMVMFCSFSIYQWVRNTQVWYLLCCNGLPCLYHECLKKIL